tara:strand:- start:272 stop:520 length:249 start_codon:yes stop_codon:yes gene_type:complete
MVHPEEEIFAVTPFFGSTITIGPYESGLIGRQTFTVQPLFCILPVFETPHPLILFKKHIFKAIFVLSYELQGRLNWLVIFSG